MTDFQISIEEFLHGVVSLTNELVSRGQLACSRIILPTPFALGTIDRDSYSVLQSRLAVNAVTAGDFARPVRIGKFLKELYSGFQLLNLKNDSLRKRFDAIKVRTSPFYQQEKERVWAIFLLI